MHNCRILPLAIPVLIACSGFVARANNSPAEEYSIRLYNTHTREHIKVVYRQGSRYIPEGLAQLDRFLRDPLNGEFQHYDPRVFDLLSDLLRSSGHPDAELQVICGYRSAASNEYLRTHTSGVAKGSLHMRAEAIDVRLPGMKTLDLRNAALALGRGGVGYYPASDFVHVDVGKVRRW